MFFYEGYSCPVCGKPFAEEDDVVSCPVCGAPHHRACWQAEGRCHFAALHGTPEQWSRETAQKAEPAPKAESTPQRVCPNCGYHNPEFAEFCAHCGRSLAEETEAAAGPSASSQMPYREYSPFHVAANPWEGVNAEERIEGVSAGDLAATVSSNVTYYLPRFRRMAAEDTSVSWNWAAFALSTYWLFYRKQYLLGTVYLLLQLVITVLSSVFYYTVFYPLMGDGLFTPESEEAIFAQLQNGTLQGPMLAVLLLSAVLLLAHVFLGLFGNRLYFNTCVHRVRRFREKKPDGYPAELAAVGGTSLVLGFTAYIAVEFLGSVIVSLLL